MLPRSKGLRLPFMVGVILLALLASCGGDNNKRAEKAAKWLKSYSVTNPPNGDWVATNIEVDKDGRVVMDVLIPHKRQVDMIRSRNKIEQSHIVRLACPPKDARIWAIMGQDLVLWVNLTARAKSGLDETLMGASCKH